MRILMIDDEAKLREKVGKFLALKGHELLEAGTGEEGLLILKENDIELVLLDLRMPGMDGLACLKEIKAMGWSGEVIMISAHGEISDAVEAMKVGAYDYLTKPFYLDDLLMKIKKLDEKIRLTQSNNYLKDLNRVSFVCKSPVKMQMMENIKRVATAGAPVLLTGETGVGKEVMARQIHELSGREGNFVPINCGAIPENLMESELFGHEKGAFSGAYQRKIGKIELAQGGTIFLDEIGELPLNMQVKLLRVLQENEMERIGGTKTIALDNQIIAATNRDLEVEIAERRFREDLYYRLNVLNFQIPPLRERKEDIIPLTEYFIAEMNQKLGKKVSKVSDEVKEQLLSYDYPGNVRELKNLVERSMILSTGDELELFFNINFKVKERIDKKVALDFNNLTLAEIESSRIREALIKNNGNRTHAAAELGISRRTIINKIKQYGLE
ncbi:MAG: sigma-54-dependent Fis family transcriptional regulator [Halanaerobiales bacterium]|nr:sigma-54-dependent Fis family transcriptional regulator [Halanaerobiales bacterium]